MFERFTTGARQTVVEAQQVVRDLGDRQIGAAHLVVALASADDPAARVLAAHGADRRTLLDRFDAPDAADDLDAAALASLGIDLDAVRRSADATFGAGALDATGAAGAGRRGPAGRPPRHVPFTAEAKKTLEVALREAVRLGHQRIEAGHVLLAVLRLRDSAGHALLLRCGVDPAALTAEVERDLAERAAA